MPIYFTLKYKYVTGGFREERGRQNTLNLIRVSSYQTFSVKPV